MYNPYGYNPYHSGHHQQYDTNQLKHMVLGKVEHFVHYGLHEAKHTSYVHALREVAAIAYLMGMGYDPRMAHKIVESWEINEQFYPGQL